MPRRTIKESRGAAPSPPYPVAYDPGNDPQHCTWELRMMSDMQSMMSGMMGWMGLAWLLLTIVVVLGIAALIKFIFGD